MRRPALIIICGLMGTGKSTLAAAISKRFGAKVIRSDVVRKELAGLEMEEHSYQPFGGGIYSEKYFESTYEALFERAESLLQDGECVVIDASFKKRRFREMGRAIAKKQGAPFLLVECVCSEKEVRKRLEERVAGKGDVSDGRWEIYGKQKADFEEVTEFPECEHMVIDTGGEMGDVIDGLMAKMDKMT